MISHHAILVRQTQDCSFEDVGRWCGDIDLADVLRVRFSQLGIDEVRTLIIEAHRQPVGSAACRLLLVQVGKITVEAQQALLKLLEEPPATTRFLFVLPSQQQLLATLQSRFHVLEPSKTNATIVLSSEWQEFLANSYADRLAVIADRLQKKDTVWLENVTHGLLRYLSELSPTASQTAVLATAVPLIGKRGSANKMLLEEVALTIPEQI